MLAIKSTLLTVFRLIFANTRGGGMERVQNIARIKKVYKNNNFYQLLNY